MSFGGSPNPVLNGAAAGAPRAGAIEARIAVVVSRYNATVTDRLLEGATAAFSRAHSDSRVTVIDAPGAFELPALCLAAAKSGRFDGVLAVGCIIKGETSHDRYLAHAVTSGLIGVTLATGVPVSLAVLTVNSPEQALDRSGGTHGNKGQEAMDALLATIRACRAIADPHGTGVPATVTTAAQTLSAPDKLARAAGAR